MNFTKGSMVVAVGDTEMRLVASCGCSDANGFNFVAGLYGRRCNFGFKELYAGATALELRL
jgi:hypothetical protein